MLSLLHSTSVNPQVTDLVEASRVPVAPDHEDLGSPSVVEPPVSGPEEQVRLLAAAGCCLVVERRD